jgi:ER-bound oxygenase mpaB/B'/Rubber oxygenase, catalytic domain
MTMACLTDAFLDDMRSVADPRADEVIATLTADGEVGRVNALMRQLTENDDALPPGLPEVARDYFAETEALPAWSDPRLIVEGERLFMERGPHIVAGLFCSSLPDCYASAKGAQVLAMTARLTQRPYRRIVETAQFVVDVMSPGGLAPGGRGIRTAQKVRLMHAGVRRLCESQPQWHPDWGRPINQEDLAGTLMTFATVVLDALHRLGVEVAPPQQEAYLHAWRNVGHLLGIDPRLIPEDVAGGRELLSAIRRRQHAGSAAGEELTAALLELMERLVAADVVIGPPHVVRYLVGDEVADLLRVPRMSALDRAALTAGSALERVIDLPLRHLPELDRAVEGFNRRLLEGLLAVTREGVRPPFRIPQALRSRWGLPTG